MFAIMVVVVVGGRNVMKKKTFTDRGEDVDGVVMTMVVAGGMQLRIVLLHVISLLH